MNVLHALSYIHTRGFLSDLNLSSVGTGAQLTLFASHYLTTSRWPQGGGTPLAIRKAWTAGMRLTFQYGFTILGVYLYLCGFILIRYNYTQGCLSLWLEKPFHRVRGTKSERVKKKNL